MKTIYIIFLFTGLTSCTKFVEDLRPIDQLTTAEVFSDSITAEAAIAGIYANQMLNYTTSYNETGIICGASADELVVNGGSFYDMFSAFNENALPIDHDKSFSYWINSYKTIYQCNIIIQAIETSAKFSEELKTKLTAEAKFLRAFTYFYLVNLFGEVPLPTTPDYRVNAQLPRSQVDKIYDLILQDLLDAKAQLPGEYASAERIRASEGAAEALMARVYLYKGNWEQAVTEADNVINAPIYSLSDPSTIFQKSSSEIILAISPASSQIFGVGEAYYFIPNDKTSMPQFSITTGLINAFEEGDLRRINWIDSNIVSGTAQYYPYKYKIREDPATSKSEYNVVLRLAEMYLIKAEALAQLGNLPGAIGALDRIRQRAGVPLVADTEPGINKENLLFKIYNEWRVEYFAEWGHRWLDLKRWGIANQVLAPIKPQWTSTAQLFPIPWEEIKANPFLTQNNGYPTAL